MKAFKTEERTVMSGLMKAIRLEMDWEETPEIFSVEVFWFLVASAYVSDSG